jgi:hypothetical protein
LADVDDLPGCAGHFKIMVDEGSLGTHEAQFKRGKIFIKHRLNVDRATDAVSCVVPNLVVIKVNMDFPLAEFTEGFVPHETLLSLKLSDRQCL